MVSRVSIIIALLLAPSAANAAWRVATTPHFEIYADTSEREIRRYAERLEGVDQLMRLAARAPDDLHPYRVRVFFLDNAADVQRVGNLSKNYSGYYIVLENGPVAVVPRLTGSREEGFGPEVTLFHEYAHHFMLQYFPAAYPSWYVEGWAELFSTSTRLGDNKVSYGRAAQGREYELVKGEWIPLELLMTARQADLPERLRDSFYGQSWLLTHYLTFSDKRAAQLRRYLAAINAGVTPKDALKVFGDDLEQLDRDLRGYLRAASFSYKPVPLTPLADNAVEVRVASAGEGALVEQAIMAREHVPDDERSAFLVDIRARTAPHANYPFALQLLADAEYAAHEFAAAERTADRLLATRPNNPRALTRKALAKLAQAAAANGAARDTMIDEARSLIVRANRAAPEDPLPLIAYFRSFAETGAEVPAIAIDGLYKAVKIVPQDQGLRLRLAHALVAKSKPREAIAILKPLAFAPHPSGAQNAARALIDRLDGGVDDAAN